MKILVIQQKMIGDVLVSSIICNNLRTAYPDAQIDYLVYSSTTPVLTSKKQKGIIKSCISNS
jgi:ADP-heptose:LPS heptosyltransferase